MNLETCYRAGIVQLGPGVGCSKRCRLSGSWPIGGEPWPYRSLSYLWGRENTPLKVKPPFVEFSLGQQAARQVPLQQ